MLTIWYVLPQKKFLIGLAMITIMSLLKHMNPANGSWCREKELAAVKINPADIDIITNELEVGWFSPSFTKRCTKFGGDD